ncbi:hypothetical protein U472_10845 [Orenia metallireducens]|uniref:CRISPR-associated protein Csc3 n=1 Tax=Orenia metallireducens TaxID=1413210 RepID=A0A1C0A8B2_9FIRM|nr:type I-D CRISPR-associated protein Cas10d/Csc3 [Orenia metallireducens]OCL26486.1 hypothetical protein U472_10845 [Orenia metallireducens]
MFSNILSVYVEEYLPKLYQQSYNFIPAKSSDFEHVELKTYTDQSLMTHILNGLYGVTGVIDYLQGIGAINLSEEDYKQLLVAYTLHDVHKLSEIERPEKEEFNISLREYQQKAKELSLDNFAEVDPKLCRAGSIHYNTYRKKGIADFASVDSLLVNLIRLADSFASSTSIDNILNSRKWLIQVVNNPHIAKKLKFEYHKLEDYRGLSTNLIHQVTKEVLSLELGLYPLFYFAEGIVYLRADNLVEVSRQEMIEKIANSFLKGVQEVGRYEGVAGTYKTSYNTFEDYALLFGGPRELLEEAKSFIANKQSTGFASDLIKSRIGKYCDSLEDFCEKFAIDLSWDGDEDKAERWGIAQRAIVVAKSIARFYLDKEEVDHWLVTKLALDEDIYDNLIENMPSRYLSDPRSKEDGLIYGYHLLNTKRTRDGRSLFEIPVAVLQENLIKLLSTILEELDSFEIRLNYVNETLGIKSDIQDYLTENIKFSFNQDSVKVSSSFKEYSKKKTGSHKKICVICNRGISSKISKKDLEIKAGIIEDNIQTFSNRPLPKMKNVSAHVWCPSCYLEFMLRKVKNLGFSPRANSNDSMRVYLFLFPDYYFTPDYLADSHKLLKPFTEMTRLKVRRYGLEDEISLSELWLTEKQGLDDWVQRVKQQFQKEAEKIKKKHEGREQRIVGEYISISDIESNFHVIPYEKSVSDNAELKHKPTRIEMLMKAIYLGALLQNLLGVRVYISQTPYLNLSNHDFKTAMRLDSIHNLLRKVLPEISLGEEGEFLGEIPLTKAEKLFDIFSAIWEITNLLYQRDKEVANVLDILNSNNLAGAYFYKRYESEKGVNASQLLKKACQILLDYFGGVKVNLVKEIAEKSFKLYIPASRQQGKAHRYENLFRTVVEGIIEIRDAEKEELITRITGKIEKRLERLRSGNTGYIPKHELADVKDLVQFILEEVFYKRCKKSYARLNQEINSLADGVYVMTDELVAKYWAEKNQENQGEAE